MFNRRKIEILEDKLRALETTCKMLNDKINSHNKTAEALEHMVLYGDSKGIVSLQNRNYIRPYAFCCGFVFSYEYLFKDSKSQREIRSCTLVPLGDLQDAGPNCYNYAVANQCDNVDIVGIVYSKANEVNGREEAWSKYFMVDKKRCTAIEFSEAERGNYDWKPVIMESMDTLF